MSIEEERTMPKVDNKVREVTPEECTCGWCVHSIRWYGGTYKCPVDNKLGNDNTKCRQGKEE